MLILQNLPRPEGPKPESSSVVRPIEPTRFVPPTGPKNLARELQAQRYLLKADAEEIGSRGDGVRH